MVATTKLLLHEKRQGDGTNPRKEVDKSMIGRSPLWAEIRFHSRWLYRTCHLLHQQLKNTSDNFYLHLSLFSVNLFGIAIIEPARGNGSSRPVPSSVQQQVSGTCYYTVLAKIANITIIHATPTCRSKKIENKFKKKKKRLEFAARSRIEKFTDDILLAIVWRRWRTTSKACVMTVKDTAVVIDDGIEIVGGSVFWDARQVRR